MNNHRIGSGIPSTVKSEPRNDEDYDVYPLRACTEEELDDTRYHILKFHSVKKIDPSTEFKEPTRLHRKDPKNLQFQMSLKELDEKKKKDLKKYEEQIKKRREFVERTGQKDLTDKEIDHLLEIEGLNDEERKEYEEKKKIEDDIKKKELEKERQLELVAPDGGARKKRTLIKNRTKQVKVYNEVKRKLRYEEFYPWVLEDYDAEQAWVSNFEANSNENYCLLILDPVEKCFKLAPVEKFYKFTSRNKYATLTLEEAEAKMKLGNSGQRWLMRKMLDEATTGKRVDLRYRKMQHKTSAADGDEDDEFKRSDEENELDYDEEFQDDEEAPIMEGPDEEKKLIESKMKKEMLSANNLIEKVSVDGIDDEDDDDEFGDLFGSKKPEDKTDKEAKKLRKALSKNAMNEVYASDDDDNDNPYISESDIESEQEEEKKIDEVKVKTEDNGEISVKEEPSDELDVGSKKKKSKKSIFVESHRSGFITIKSSKQILSQFPKGEWNPRTAILRDLTEEPESQPQAAVNSSLAEESVSSQGKLTVEDIDNLLVNGPISLSNLVKALRGKLANDPNVKDVLRKILKENFILKNKQVYRKDD